VGGDWGGIGAEFEQCKALKQPDVLLLLTLFPERFDEECWRVNWDYYERFILHGSSLSPSIHALVGARAGLPQRARYYFDLASRFEFRNQNQDTHQGIHIGNCGGLWQAMVSGFAGLVFEAEGRFRLDPRLPVEWGGFSFRLNYRAARFRVAVSKASVEIASETGADEEGERFPTVWAAFGTEKTLEPGASLRFQKS
jgi:kojibiose phosphorylase